MWTRPAPDVVKTVTLSAADKARSNYHLVDFEVPEGVTRFDLHMVYPKAEDCVVDLGLGDPDLGPFPSESGLVGWSGGARDRVFVGADAATPGYRPGMAPGSWTVILGLYRLPEAPVDVTLRISFDRTPRVPAVPAEVPSPARQKAGWYRGDLQCHTFHSDAKGAPEHLHATAIREQLDFLVVTDHNTLTAHPTYFERASSPQLIFVPGYEFTTEFGHANVFGATRVEDFRVETGDDVLGMVARLRGRGHLFSINHDKPDIPWNWPVPEIDCMEVWQAPWLAGNHHALAKYQDRLVAGQRITAIGGSDFHQPGAEPEGNPLTLARPCTYLWCEELSVAGILDALRAGRSFVTESPDGPRLTLWDGATMQGGEMPAGPRVVRAEVENAPGEMLELWDATGRICWATVGGSRDVLDFRVEPEGFLRAQLVAEATREARIAEARAALGGGNPGHADWQGSLDQPLVRALTSPLWVT